MSNQDQVERMRRALNATIDGHEYACDAKGNLTLKLAHEGGRVRAIGKIDIYDDTVHWWRRASLKNTMHKVDGWGLNAAVLQALNEVDGKVVISAWDGDYVISAWGAIAIGDWGHYKRQGFEKQVFVKRENFMKATQYGRHR